MEPVFRAAAFRSVRPGPLAALAETAAERLRAAKQTVAVFEATTGGLIQAALQAVPGASAYTTCGAVTYGARHAVAVLGADLSGPRPADGPAYRQAKSAWTQMLARRMRDEVGATWCISESGACGPTFNYPDIATGFTSIFVCGPVERGITVESPHDNREENMWGFAQLALDLLAECVAEAAAARAGPLPGGPPAEAEAAAAGEAEAAAAAPGLLTVKEDRFGGVEVEVPDSAAAGASAARFARELRQGLEAWQAGAKKGVWLRIPLSCAAFVGPAAAQGFAYHHARPEYVLLTRWLAEGPSPLPRHGFTQVGVGGVVVNGRGEVLMVQERVSPLPVFQGTWKLPGGLADPGEDFAETVCREVREETGVTGSLVGVVSLRHSHGFRFGQADLYVLVKLRADKEDITIDPHELSDAQWMSRERIASLVAEPSQPLDGRVSENNWRMIRNALDGALIVAAELPASRGGAGRPTLLYTACPPGDGSQDGQARM